MCLVRLEESGFFLVWEPSGKPARMLDMAEVWEARPGLSAVREMESVAERTVWITYGQSFTVYVQLRVGVWALLSSTVFAFRVNSLYLVARSARVARSWRAAINAFIQAYRFRDAPPMACLHKQ